MKSGKKRMIWKATSNKTPFHMHKQIHRSELDKGFIFLFFKSTAPTNGYIFSFFKLVQKKFKFLSKHFKCLKNAFPQFRGKFLKKCICTSSHL